MKYANTLLQRFSLSATRLYWVNAGLLVASAVVYGLFATMTAQQNGLTLMALLNRSLPTVTMFLMVLLNAVLGLVLMRFQAGLQKTPYRLRALMLVQVGQQFLSLNPILVLSALGVVITNSAAGSKRLGWRFWLLAVTLSAGYLLVTALRLALR